MRKSSCRKSAVYQLLVYAVTGASCLIWLGMPRTKSAKLFPLTLPLNENVGVIVKQGVLDVFLERYLAAKLEGMAPARVAKRIANGIKICAGSRAADRLPQIEENVEADVG